MKAQTKDVGESYETRGEEEDTPQPVDSPHDNVLPSETASKHGLPWFSIISIFLIGMAIMGLWTYFEPKEGPEQMRGKPVIAPGLFEFSTITYERHPTLKLRRLIIAAHTPVPSDADVQKALDYVHKVVKKKQPLTILYDCRDVSLPTLTMKQYGMGINWAMENGGALDVQLQCIAFTFGSPFVRAAAQAVVAFMQPPQPVHIGSDEASALRFAQEKCNSKRNWSEESKKRDLASKKNIWK